MSNIKTIPISTETLIPYDGKMKFIYTFETYNDIYGECLLEIKDNIFLNKNKILDPIIFLEYLSQLTAAFFSYKYKNFLNNFGLLVGIKKFRINKEIKKGDKILIKIEATNHINSFLFVNGIISKKNEVIASGIIKVYLNENENMNIVKDKIKDKLPKKTFKQDSVPLVITSIFNDLKKEILNNIFKLEINSQKDEGSSELFFYNSFIGFDGHFPGFPILPGVVILEIGKVISEIIINKPLKLVRVDKVKFSKIIVPEQKINVLFTISKFEQYNRILFKFFHNKTLCAKYSIEMS